MFYQKLTMSNLIKIRLPFEIKINLVKKIKQNIDKYEKDDESLETELDNIMELEDIDTSTKIDMISKINRNLNLEALCNAVKEEINQFIPAKPETMKQDVYDIKVKKELSMLAKKIYKVVKLLS